MRKMTRAPGRPLRPGDPTSRGIGPGLGARRPCLHGGHVRAGLGLSDAAADGRHARTERPVSHGRPPGAVTPNGTEGDNLCGTDHDHKTDSWTGKALAGAGFTLYWGPCPKTGLPDSHDAVDSPSSLTNPVTTDSSGAATFTPVYFKWWGGKQYCVVETTVPAGYSGASPQTVTVYGSYSVPESDTRTCTAPTDNQDQSNVAELPQICVLGGAVHQ